MGVNGSGGSAGLFPGVERMLGNRPYDIPSVRNVIPIVKEGSAVKVL
jgi:hypothetical protein